MRSRTPPHLLRPVRRDGEVVQALLTSEEHQELLHYLSHREHLWTPADGVYFRLDEEGGTPVGLLQLIPHEGLGMMIVSIDTVGDGVQEELDELLSQILAQWTLYGVRLMRSAFLQSQGIDAAKADELALGLSHVTPPNGTLPETLAPRSLIRSGIVGTFLFAGGGYVHLELKEDVLLCKLSCPNASGGYMSQPLYGILRPSSGSTRDQAALIANWSDAWPPSAGVAL